MEPENNEQEILLENEPILMGGGTSDFNELENRPKYGGVEMTGDTDIPLPPEVFDGATTEDDGTSGLVPAPTTLDTEKYLKGDGNWGRVADLYTSSSTSGDITSYDYYVESSQDGSKRLGLSFDYDDNSSDVSNVFLYLDDAFPSINLLPEEQAQRKLTAGSNIQIDNDNVISATDTTYTAGTNVSISGNVISATDTTYSNFVGTDGVSDGSAGLVPAPLTTDDGKFLKSDGTWDTAGGTLYSGIGANTDGAMTQKATTEMVYGDGATAKKIKLGTSAMTNGTDAIAIGSSAYANGYASIAIGSGSSVLVNQSYGIVIGSSASAKEGAVKLGYNGNANGKNSVALGYGASTSNQGEINITTSSSLSATSGWNNTRYRLIRGLYDGQELHDAATLAQGNTLSASAPTTSTVGVVGQLMTDTTNGGLYQCTAIDTTDPNNPVYTWNTVGGGSSMTLYTDLGTNTDGPMTQKAVTEKLFNLSDTSWRRIQIGKDSVSNGSSTVAVGHSAEVYGAQGVAVGNYAEVAMNHGVAIGPYAAASQVGSIALGYYSRASRKGEFNIGLTTSTEGFNSSKYRLISGVYDGQDLHDAATVAQGNTLATSAPTTSTVGVLGQLYTDTTNMHTYQCTAISGSTYTWTQRW